MHTQYLNPTTLCPTFGWTHVVVVTGGKTVYISGQVGIDERGVIVGKDDLRAQTQQAFLNIERALASVGATFQHVVKTSFAKYGVAMYRQTTRHPARWSESPRWSGLIG
jgi:enamine deaminase RidA (YjgF/YER057c/UK114 family)